MTEDKEITTLAEFKRYLSAVRKAVGSKGGKTPTTKRKGLAALSPERRMEISAQGCETRRDRKDFERWGKPSAPSGK